MWVDVERIPVVSFFVFGKVLLFSEDFDILTSSFLKIHYCICKADEMIITKYSSPFAMATAVDIDVGPISKNRDNRVLRKRISSLLPHVLSNPP